MPFSVVGLVAGMLLFGVLPLPYGYYPLLRLVVCGVFSFAAYHAFQKSHGLYPWILVLTAVLFNPIVPVHLPKELWAVLDVGAAVLLVVGYRMGKISRA